MSKERPRNLAASVRQRLTNLARERGEQFQHTLVRYGIERLLVRLDTSGHGERFVLKGAMLFAAWTGLPHRPTEDLDLLGRGDPDPARLAEVFREVCRAAVEEDGLTFRPETVRAEAIKEGQDYPGVRVRCDAELAGARVPLQIDVGFGDAVTPPAEALAYPTLLGQPGPTVPAYPRETVVAEKFQAMVALGIANSRMKDFFDLSVLARGFDFAGPTLAAALRATFDRRGTPLPAEPPLALTPEFATDRQKATQWGAFIRRGRLSADTAGLAEVCEFLAGFLMPPARAAAAGVDFPSHWTPGGPWRDRGGPGDG